MLTIFVVDESAEVRKRLVELISNLREKVLIGQSEHALEAIASIQRLRPQVVIMDFHMPNGNSLQAVTAVRALDAAICIIKLSTFPFPQYRSKCLNAGADYFLDKACESEQIVAILEQLLAKKIGLSEQLSTAREIVIRPAAAAVLESDAAKDGQAGNIKSVQI